MTATTTEIALAAEGPKAQNMSAPEAPGDRAAVRNPAFELHRERSSTFDPVEVTMLVVFCVLAAIALVVGGYETVLRIQAM